MTGLIFFIAKKKKTDKELKKKTERELHMAVTKRARLNAESRVLASYAGQTPDAHQDEGKEEEKRK